MVAAPRLSLFAVLRGMARGGVPLHELPATEVEAAAAGYALPSAERLHALLDVAARLVAARLSARALGSACQRLVAVDAGGESALGDAYRVLASSARRGGARAGREDAQVLLDRYASMAAPTDAYPSAVVEDARVALHPPGAGLFAVVAAGGAVPGASPDPLTPVPLVVQPGPAVVPATDAAPEHATVTAVPTGPGGALSGDDAEAALAVADGVVVELRAPGGALKGRVLSLRGEGGAFSLFGGDATLVAAGDALVAPDLAITRFSPQAADVAALLALALLSASEGRFAEAFARWGEAWGRAGAGQRTTLPLGAYDLATGDAPPATSPSIYGESADEA